jgi:hypothetical protein
VDPQGLIVIETIIANPPFKKCIFYGSNNIEDNFQFSLIGNTYLEKVRFSTADSP